MEKISRIEQVKRISQIMKHDAVSECPCCGLKFIPLYTYEGYGLCPDCDEEFLDNYKKKLDKVS